MHIEHESIAPHTKRGRFPLQTDALDRRKYCIQGDGREYTSPVHTQYPVLAESGLVSLLVGRLLAESQILAGSSCSLCFCFCIFSRRRRSHLGTFRAQVEESEEPIFQTHPFLVFATLWILCPPASPPPELSQSPPILRFIPSAAAIATTSASASAPLATRSIFGVALRRLIREPPTSSCSAAVSTGVSSSQFLRPCPRNSGLPVLDPISKPCDGRRVAVKFTASPNIVDIRGGPNM